MLDAKILAGIKNTLLYDPVKGIFTRRDNIKPAYLKPNKAACPRVLVLGKEYSANLVACFLMTGVYPQKFQVKILDGNKDNLKWDNLYITKEGYKFCSKCKEEKPFSDYSQNKGRKAGIEPECKECNRLIHKKQSRKYNLKKFGLTEECYVSILDTQNRTCAICKQQETNGRKLAVDHCHDTGKVRGILCMRCNTAIGKLSTPELLSKAIDYLST